MKNHMQNIAEPHRNMATFAEETERRRRSPRGISGLPVRASTARNDPSRTSPASSGSRVAAAVQPSASVWEMP
jgi:hypothetical protein